MTAQLLLAAAVIFACVIFSKISSRLGIPTLLAFILLGIFFGSDGVVKIPFDDLDFAQELCSLALIFIMFYGGFGTKWSEARPVAVRALVLSSLGTGLTAGLVGLFCRFCLGTPLLESFLIGSVISSTDAASVFSILRSKRLNLRDGTASLLELESGSNDPFSYLLTVTVLSMMNGSASGGALVGLLFAQVGVGLAFGAAAAILAALFLRRVHLSASGYDAIFIVAVAIASYAGATACGGNGYLSTYLTGILLGNRSIANKQALVHFFDGATGLMQMLLFFLLGLLSFPSRLPQVAATGLAVALFLTLVARPVAVFAILTPFRAPVRQQLLVAWAGMRGAASIVFAILAMTDTAVVDIDIFHIVFFIVLFSILLQGSLIPLAARMLHMTDGDADVMKTFNDYTDQVPVQFLQCAVPPGHPWCGRRLDQLSLPPETLLVLVLRREERLVPSGATVLLAGDTLVLSGKALTQIGGIHLSERTVQRDDYWAGRQVSSIPAGEHLIIMIQRNGGVVIPHGTTTLLPGDVLVMHDLPSGDGVRSRSEAAVSDI